MKIFCIGFNKTGTTTLGLYFSQIGYKTLHNRIWDGRLDDYDVFCDGEHTIQEVERLYDAYPNALFILNVRNFFNWCLSREKHNKKKNDRGIANAPVNSREQITKWIKRRETYYKNVVQFFKTRPHQLIVVDIEHPSMFEVLNKRFVGDVKNIHAHKIESSKFDEEFVITTKQIITDCFSELGYTIEEMQMALVKGLAVEDIEVYDNNLESPIGDP